jgi:hypothetical protein
MRRCVSRSALLPAALAAATAVLAGCPAAPLPEDPYVAEVTRAARAERENRWSEAARAYEQAATLTADEAMVRSAQIRAAETLERAGEADEALRVYLALADEHPGTDEAGRGLYNAAQLERKRGREDEAIALYRRLLHQEPQFPLVEVAVRWLAQIYGDREQLAELVQLLAEELAAAEGGDDDLLAVLHLFRARTLVELDRRPEAYADLDAGIAVCPYPTCAFWDDLPWAGVKIAQDAGEFRTAIEWIDRLLFWKEECWTLGASFYSAYYDNAQLLKAELLRDELDEPQAAAAAFLELENFTESVLRDDGLYEAALLFLDRLGEPERGCDVLRGLLETYPDSNRRRAAQERLDRPPCSGS